MKFIRSAVIKAKPFYRSFPYTSPLYIGSVDHRGVVDVERRFFFNRIPKCGNSTVVKAIGHNSGISIKEIEYLKDELRKPSSLSRLQMDQFRTFFKFTIVRNPYIRTLSAYLDIFEGKGRSEDFGIHSFDEFCQYLVHGGLYSNIHWAPQVDCLLLPTENFDHIARFENLGGELEYIGERIDMNLDPETHRHAPHATGAGSQLQKHYTSEIEAIVRGLYAADFAAFGYEPTLRAAMQD